MRALRQFKYIFNKIKPKHKNLLYGVTSLSTISSFKKETFFQENGDIDLAEYYETKLDTELKKGDSYQKIVDTCNNGIEKGSLKCTSLLGLYYILGIGVERNPQTSFELFEKIYLKGDLSTIDFLIAYYIFGVGVDRNIEKAAELVDELKSKDELPPNVSAYEMVIKKINSCQTESEIDTYLKEFIKTEENNVLNDNNSALLLGILYLYGLGVKQNFEKAVKYLLLVGFQNNYSLMCLSVCYCYGLGVDKDPIVSSMLSLMCK